MSEQVLMDAAQIDDAVRTIAQQVYDSCKGLERFAIVGIQTRGIHLADRIRSHIEKLSGASVPHGVLDITFYRDDLTSRGSLPVLKETKIAFDMEGMTILLVDDVLFTGRTIKAALDTLTDYGRPKRILLAVLADRGNRELPIQPDFCALNIETHFTDEVLVHLSEADGADSVVLVKGEKEKNIQKNR